FRRRAARPAGRRSARWRRRRGRFRGRELRTHINSTGPRLWSFGGDPLRPASPVLRSHCVFGWRPAATGFAALAIATRLLTHDWPPGRDRDARRRGPPARHAAAVYRRPRRGARRRGLRDTLGPRRPRVPGRCPSGPDGPLGETARPVG